MLHLSRRAATTPLRLVVQKRGIHLNMLAIPISASLVAFSWDRPGKMSRKLMVIVCRTVSYICQCYAHGENPTIAFVGFLLPSRRYSATTIVEFEIYISQSY